MFLKNPSKLITIILFASLISSCSQPLSYKRPQIIANFGNFDCNTYELKGQKFTSVWEKVNAGFCLDVVHSSRVDKEINWFLNNKAFIYRSIERSKPFLYHVISELEKNNLPFELALLPIVESGYQPYAYSPSKAAGIWQFIPPTAKEYKLSSNWWYDGRRDVLNSTKAAAHFLRDMHRHFKKDWLLAIASYNTGAGKVGRSIRKVKYVIGKTSFWDLSLPRETEIYVPKLLALRDIISNPRKYNINLPQLKNKPYTKFTKIDYPIDFFTISILSGVSEGELYSLNPGFNTWYFLPSMQNKILLPIENIKIFKDRYAKFSRLIYQKKMHTIQSGDTLSSISRLYNVSIKSIKVLNNLKSDLIIAGKKLKLPLKGVSAVSKTVTINKKEYKISDKTFNYNHLVRRYDNWYRIAKFYNVKLRILLKWNKATKKTKLLVGDKLIIKMKVPILSNTDKINLRYVVSLGDTTNIVSTGFAISKKTLLKTNNIKNSKYLMAGKNLIIVK